VTAIIFVAGILIYFRVKKKNDQWSGVLLKKNHYPGDMETNESWKLVFKTDDGKKKRYQVKKQVFEQWNEGDKAVKKQGSYMPEKS
jgi:hypothetical protein